MNEPTELQKAVDDLKNQRQGHSDTYSDVVLLNSHIDELLSAAKQLSALQTKLTIAETTVDDLIPLIATNEALQKENEILKGKNTDLENSYQCACQTEQLLIQDSASLKSQVEELKRNIRAANFPKEQATTCGKCGVYKHTPWRDDEYGYVCATCLVAIKDDERDSLTAALKECLLERERLLNVMSHCALDPDKQPPEQHLVARSVVRDCRNKDLSNTHVQKLLKP